METKITPNSWRAWWLAIRPKTLAAAVVPVATASALAGADGHFIGQVAALCTLFALLMQVAANFINDLFDFEKGTDREDRLGPERACAQGWITAPKMRIGIGITIVAACLVGCGLLPYGSWLLVVVGLSCVLFAFLYTTLLSYCGGGDLLVYVFFGLVPVSLTYYLQTGELTAQVWWLCGAIGLSTDTLLVLNNYRDRDTDRKSNKQTLIVRWGERFGSAFYLVQGVLAGGCGMVVLGERQRWMVLLMGIYLLLHMRTWQKMRHIRHGKALNGILGETARNITLLGVLLTVGICCSMYMG